MSWRTMPLAVAARNVGRALGLNRWIARAVRGAGYEARFDEALCASIRPGDRVWDIGANIGHYTQRFAASAGPGGLVEALEPSPVNFARLGQNCSRLGNVRLHQIGLGDRDCSMQLSQGEDELGATSRLLDAPGGGVEVRIRTGASLIDSGELEAPNAVKIDVEGYEYEVLVGLKEHLGARSLRTVGIEVHFGILNSRGMPWVPMQLERLLDTRGFKVSWSDSSHVIARRGET